ncbi:RNB domain-containing protein [Rathayibacter tanaceti]|uniref:RNB domain-containing ribonuclease n=2 Tax=Rathayibacter tanaceti TaxID=1671680 RepID=A0AAE6RJF5_9MICO|nr:RNB domain-containing ribonuclease [Rathayibacter tanaceti]QHC55809.1 RNB domain-containing ribonuclease [Rathayibacter tanaceti]TCO39368.1 RNB domain-containing protein [Rathayibacter tanaceti]
MTGRRLRLPRPDDDVDRALAAVRVAIDLPGAFPAEALAEAEHADANAEDGGRSDRTDLPFVTIDPPGSLDLDQALHLERTTDGVVLRYAIADVPAVVHSGGALDAEARRRGQTVYLPDGRIPLHPAVLSEGTASLLPDVRRRALVWTLTLDERAEPRSVRLERSLVRSVARLDYGAVQRSVEAGEPHPSIALLAWFGRERLAREAERGGASLTLPEEEIVAVGGGYRVERRAPLAVEAWNAQVSLLTGMVAARMMLGAGVGILRTMPAADPETVAAFRARAAALGTPWPTEEPYGAYLRRLDTGDPAQLAVMHAAATLFRGAGYTAFDGTPPEHPAQSALAAPYAHVTAPLRRLVDRFGLAVCLAVSNGDAVPDGLRAALPGLPPLLAASDRRAGAASRAATAIVEAAILRGREGASFTGVVVSSGRNRSAVQLLEPEITVDVQAPLLPGARVVVVLESVDVATGSAVFGLSA